MIDVAGRQVLADIAEKLDPAHAAVVMVDMQKDFTARGFWWDGLGQLDDDPIEDLPGRMAGFLEVARASGVKVVHLNACYDPEYLNDAMLERMHRLGIAFEACQSGSEGIEPHPGLEPREDETVVIKHRYDGFFGTDLHLRLQAAGIRTLVVTGVAVHGCVDSTIRHAYFHGYYVVLVEDLTGGGSAEAHRVTLDSVNLMFGVTATSDEVTAVWTGQPRQDTAPARDGGAVASRARVARRRTEADVPALIEALTDDDRYTRLSASRGLEEIGDAAVEPLIATLSDLGAALALIRIGEPAVEPLIEALGDHDWLVRSHAALALGELAGPPAFAFTDPHPWDPVAPLVTALGDEHETVRIRAAWALGRIGDPRAVEPLTALAADPDGGGQESPDATAAVLALEHIGPVTAT